MRLLWMLLLLGLTIQNRNQNWSFFMFNLLHTKSVLIEKTTMQRAKRLCLEINFSSFVFNVDRFRTVRGISLSELTKNYYYSSFSFNSSIRTHLNSGHPEKALTHFTKFREQGLLPDNFTIPSLLKLSYELDQPSSLNGENLHAFAVKTGYLRDIFVGTGFIEMYFNFGYFSASHKLFDEITERDVVLWTAMISGFSQNGFAQEALYFLPQMLGERIKPNKVTLTSVLSACSQLILFNLGRAVHGFSIRNLIFKYDVILETALVDMYSKCRNLIYSSRVFDRMIERNCVSWNAIIAAHLNHGSLAVALNMFREMIWRDTRELKPSTLALVLQICGGTADLRSGRETHGHIIRSCRISNSDSLVEKNSLFDMYVKSGDLRSATLIFDSIVNKNLVTWTTMIKGYGMHGLSKEALKTFDQMKKSGIKPDGITFIALLSACSHGKLVDEGKELYISMQKDYKIMPEMKHFACMVDLYARAGFLEQAYGFIEGMPIEPSEFIWETLLSSCRLYKNVELGEKAAKKALELDQSNAGVYILLSRLYADTGRWEDLSKVRLVMKKMGLKPATACSWVEVERKIFTFTVKDRTSKYSMQIYNLLQTLKQSMEKAGFVSDSSGGHHNISEEEKESDLCGHTEKLALAFALIKSGGHGVIRIGKNLRVCRYCHESFKFISNIINREIVLRDPNRYHHFRRGQCTCHDFW